MNIVVKSDAPALYSTECLIVFTGNTTGCITAKSLSEEIHTLLEDIVERGDLENKAGKCLLLPYIPSGSAKRILLVATGPETADCQKVQDICQSVASTLSRNKISEATICITDLLKSSGADKNWIVSQLAQTFTTNNYQFDQFKTNSEKNELRALTLLCSSEDEKALQAAAQNGIGIGNGINTARELGNLPGNVCTPEYLAQEATQLTSSNSKLTVDILDEKAMEELGMNAFLSVSKGSVNEGRMIIMHYKGGLENEAPYVLVGKGITFDTGGICIKPAPNMDEMKFDMCGAASVMGAMKAVTELNLPVNVIGIIASAENMPAGNATRPGDIISSMSGQTIEIMNTDAEGRLVLCDALTYTEKFSPAAVIDIATLTGACVIALGHHISGMVSNNDQLAKQLQDAGKESLDEVWRLPANESYEKQLESPCADMQNIGGKPAGTITAGCFLSKFTKSYPWAHIDIAGTAWKSGKEKAATGRPVSLLVQFLQNLKN